MIDITTVLEALIALAVSLITAFVIPWLNSKIKAEQFAMLQEWAKVFVSAAEVIFKGSKLGEEKKQYVLTKLKERCEQHGMTFSEDELNAVLECMWEILIGSPSTKEEDE